MTLIRDGDRWAVEGRWYRLRGTVDGPVAILEDRVGRRWAELRLLASLDVRGGDDETFAVSGPTIADGRTREDPGAVDRVRLEWALTSSIWRSKRLAIEATDEDLTIWATVVGDGLAATARGNRNLTTVSLLAGRVVSPRASGSVMSGSWFESLVPAGPGDPGRIVLPASESASIGVVSGSEAGRGRWFFAPGPFVFSATHERPDGPAVIPAGPWLSFAIDAVAGEAGFTEVAWRAADRGFGIVLDYDDHTPAVGGWTTPPLVIGEGADAYAGIAAQRDRLRRPGGSGRPGASGRPTRSDRPDDPDVLTATRTAADWWREPIFCGWGAQCADAAADGQPLSAAASRATRARYDRWLAHLEAERIVPGTISIDDKWQASYGANEPDSEKWPDLRGWIAARHDRGQRVLLWYKAWDPAGLPPELCVRTTAGTPIGIDPTNPDAEAAIRRSVRTMLAPDGLDADGLKIDFTARTPSGRAAVHHGGAWGVDLLRRLLDILADEAGRAKPDALLVGQTPNPIVAPAVGMIRLNDALRLDDPRPDVDIVPQMRYRAAIVAAACPDHLIDTDDWCVPDLTTWRAYAAIKSDLGVPALYYVTHLDRTGERFQPSDYALIRETWAAYRARVGLPPRP